jgi:hypothetical protein
MIGYDSAIDTILHANMQCMVMEMERRLGSSCSRATPFRPIMLFGNANAVCVGD